MSTAFLNRIDRNASAPNRLRRNMQRLGRSTNPAIASTVALLGTITESQVINLTTDLANRMLANTTLSTLAPLAGGGLVSTNLTLSMPQASSTANGWLSSTDWTHFNTDAIFGASGSTHAAGDVPDPGSTAGSTRFLREDATWAAVSSGGSTAIIAADASILIGSSTGSTTLKTNDDPTGGLQTLSTGLGIELNDHPPTVVLNVDFTAMAVGTIIGTIGGAGVTWHIVDGVTPVASPLDSNDFKVQTGGSYGGLTYLGVNPSVNNNALAIYMPAISPGSKYNVTSVAFPAGTLGSGLPGIFSLYAMIDNVGWAAQGVVAQFYQDYVTVFDFHSGTTLGSASVPTVSAFATFSLLIDTVAKTITVSRNGVNLLTVSKTTDLTNTACGFYMGQNMDPTLTAAGVKSFSVTGTVTTHSGLYTNAGGLGILLADTSLVLSSSGIQTFIQPPFTAGPSSTITNVSSATSFGLTYVLPANFMTVGKTVRVRFGGMYTSGGLSPAFAIVQYMNGIAGGANDGNGAPNTGATTSGRFFMEDTWILSSTGSGGLISSVGYAYLEITPGQYAVQAMGQHNKTFNTTIANTIDLGGWWIGGASASNTAFVTYLSIEFLN